MTLTDILSPVRPDLNAVNELISRRLSSNVVLINQLGAHIVASGGKRLRPALALLAARAIGYAGQDHIQIAAIIEFIHTATLLHDDVVDHSDLRRGTPTANSLWGNEASVLTGDFLYSRAFQLMVELNKMPVLGVMANTTNVIAEGEVLQLMNCHNPDITEAIYDDVIERKTAILFEAAAQCGALIAGGDEDQIASVATYGKQLGFAFQLIDDCLDYSADTATTGKNLGDDLAEGKTTLPLIFAMKNADAASKDLIANAIRTGGREHLEAVITIIEASGALPYTAKRAQTAAHNAIQALAPLPDSPYKLAMEQLANFAVSRAY